MGDMKLDIITTSIVAHGRSTLERHSMYGLMTSLDRRQWMSCDRADVDSVADRSNETSLWCGCPCSRNRQLSAMLTDGTGKAPKHALAKAILKDNNDDVSSSLR